MKQYIFQTNKVKIIVKDPEKYRTRYNNNKIKAVFEIWKQSNRKNNKEWRKIATHMIPRGILKRLGVKMQENDLKEITESGETCLLEYE